MTQHEPDTPAEPERLQIGAFSRASGISVRTLRNYHDSGLLVPAVVDPATGYRSYGLDQLADALVIVRLRALDLPLTMVHEVLRRRDPAFTSEVLDRHRGTMEDRLRETEQIVTALQSGISTSTTPAHIQRVEATTVLSVTEDVAGEDMAVWIEHTIGHLYDVAGGHATSGAIPGGLYPPELVEDDHEVITAFVVIDEPFLVPPSAHRAIVTDLPSCEVAVLAHADGFETIGETYRLLGAWVARHGESDPALHVRELYHELAPGLPTSTTIEILWPMARSLASG